MEWGPLVEWCEAQTWTATHYCLRHQSQREAGDVRSDDGCRWEICDIWELCAERVDCVTGRQLPTLLDCLCLALPFVRLSLALSLWRCLPSARMRSEGTVVVGLSVCLLLYISLLERLFVPETIPSTQRATKVRK